MEKKMTRKELKNEIKLLYLKVKCMVIHRNNYLIVQKFTTCDDMFYVACSKCCEVYFAGKAKDRY
jgi:hypothetical protein